MTRRLARDATAYVESLELFGMELGLDRMRALLGELGDPQARYPAIHVVGTNGKTTTTRLTEALLAAEGLAVGAYTSPHVGAWAERIRVGGAEADFERAIERVRPAAESLRATQFEVVTAAALAEFAAAGIDVAVVEAGLGGRLDATNVLRSPVQVLTNVALEHIEHLGPTRESIAAEKLAVVQPGSTVVLGEPEWEDLAQASGAGRTLVVARNNLALAEAAASAFLGRDADPAAAAEVRLPGRLEQVGEEPLEIHDGAHNLAGVGYLLPRLPVREGHGWTLVLSILADKEAEGMLAAFAALGDRLVATSSGHARALPAGELARLARPFFRAVEAAERPEDAVERARSLAGPRGAVLVSGSLYLLAALRAVRSPRIPWDALASG